MEQKIYKNIYKQTMKKLICYLTLNGKKHLAENGFLRMSKNLQKCSNKNSKNSLKLSIIFSMQIFKINALTKSTQKNRTFPVLYKNKNRTFSATKFLLQITQKQQQNTFYKKLYKKILFILENDSFIFLVKQNLQEQVSFKKNLFSHYRWR